VLFAIILRRKFIVAVGKFLKMLYGIKQSDISRKIVREEIGEEIC